MLLSKFLFSGPEAGEEGRILLFGTKEGLKTMARSGEWYIDGTFDHTPDGVEQMWVIKARVNDVNKHPPFKWEGNRTGSSIKNGSIEGMVYVLMPNRKEIAYIRVCRMLKDLEVPILNYLLTT